MGGKMLRHASKCHLTYPSHLYYNSYLSYYFQIQLMQEMVGTARRMGNHAIATRHMTYLLEVMFDHCSDTEKTDFSSQLSVLTSRHPGKFDHCIALTLRVIFSHEISKFTSRFSHLTNF